MSELSFPLSGQINLSCQLARGSLVVRTSDDRDVATVRLSPRGANSGIADRVEVALHDNTLIVHAPRRQRSLVGAMFGAEDAEAIDVEVSVPTGTAMELVTSTAAVAVYGRSGSAQIKTGSSNVTVGHIDGDGYIRTGSGRVEIDEVSGDLAIKIGSGGVRVGGVAQSLQVTSGSGNIALGVTRGPVRVRAGSGSIEIDTAGSDVDVTSGSGTITIGLPAGLQARLDVFSGSGAMRTEMPVSDVEPTGATSTVTARTGSGNVTVRRSQTELPTGRALSQSARPALAPSPHDR